MQVSALRTSGRSQRIPRCPQRFAAFRSQIRSHELISVRLNSSLAKGDIGTRLATGGWAALGSPSELLPACRCVGSGLQAEYGRALDFVLSFLDREFRKSRVGSDITLIVGEVIEVLTTMVGDIRALVDARMDTLSDELAAAAAQLNCPDASRPRCSCTAAARAMRLLLMEPRRRTCRRRRLRRPGPGSRRVSVGSRRRAIPDRLLSRLRCQPAAAVVSTMQSRPSTYD
jgi:hypothetical protein